MEKTLQVINELEKEGVIERYALGGATALLFYAEPALTFDVDIFVILPSDKDRRGLVNLGPIYKVLQKRGYTAEKEHVMIEGVPIQFISVYNPLVEEAVREASLKDYQGINTRVVGLEHLLAIMIDTNRPIATLFAQDGRKKLKNYKKEADKLFQAKRRRRAELAKLPIVEKVKILVQLQKIASPLLLARGIKKRPWVV